MISIEGVCTFGPGDCTEFAGANVQPLQVGLHHCTFKPIALGLHAHGAQSQLGAIARLGIETALRGAA